MVERARVEVTDHRLEEAMRAEMKKIFAEPLPERKFVIPKIDYSAFDQYAGLIRRSTGELVKWLEMPALPFKREMSHAQWSELLNKLKQQFGIEMYKLLEENKFRTNKLTGLSTSVELMEIVLSNDPSPEGREIARLIQEAWGDGKVFREEIAAYAEMTLKQRIEKLKWFENKVITFLDALAREADRRNSAMEAA